jgi:hypothetical protein
MHFGILLTTWIATGIMAKPLNAILQYNNGDTLLKMPKELPSKFNERLNKTREINASEQVDDPEEH